MLTASLAASQTREAEMVSELLIAIQGFDRAQARMDLAASRRRLGQLLGGGEGAQLTAAGEAYMRRQGVRDFDRMTELTVPAFDRKCETNASRRLGRRRSFFPTPVEQ